jgi:GAF domain-containing protein
MTDLFPLDAPTTAAYAELSKIILTDQPLTAVLARLARLAQELIPDAAEVSVTLIDAGRPQTIAFAGALAPVLDERQYASGRGPCMDAAVTGQIIELDTATDQLYPEFSGAAARAGMRHVLAVGMPALHSSTGALNVYSTATSGPFTAQARDIAAGFVGYTSVALATAALYAGAVNEVAQMKQAMASRAVIEQAKGMIMMDRRCTDEEAFAVLRDASSRTNQKLRVVAQFIVAEAVAAPAPARHSASTGHGGSVQAVPGEAC